LPPAARAPGSLGIGIAIGTDTGTAIGIATAIAVGIGIAIAMGIVLVIVIAFVIAIVGVIALVVPLGEGGGRVGVAGAAPSFRFAVSSWVERGYLSRLRLVGVFPPLLERDACGCT
jgi:hypothetical protein